MKITPRAKLKQFGFILDPDFAYYDNPDQDRREYWVKGRLTKFGARIILNTTPGAYRFGHYPTPPR